MTNNSGMYVDVSAVLRGGAVAPEPDILEFVDASYLFYSGEFNLIYGDTECGKTWLCLAAVASTLKRGGRAAIIDLDHNGAASLINRLQLLGVPTELLTDLHSFRLSEPVTELELRRLVSDLTVFRPDVVVLDSLGEVIPLFRGNSNNSDDFTLVHGDVIKPLARAGAAVLVVDHLPKNADSRQHGPIGTQAKTRAVGGLAVKVSVEQAFRPGKGGAATLELFKDRHGGVRQQLPDNDHRPVIGTFKVIEDDTGHLTYGFQHAVTVALDKQAKYDRARAVGDAATLLDLYDGGKDVDTIRAIKEALNCGQSRAELARTAFQEELKRRAAEAA
ncbi:AAA family ATPase [Mycobacterium sp. E2699]|uniref:AAA family ATPase n=1 Tax=Mycobacterium sp. E2699 TaxID=1834137 RepID=UPI0009ECFB60|nr:AAA family ATPase [Mycobacterium sp. E2699]